MLQSKIHVLEQELNIKRNETELQVSALQNSLPTSMHSSNCPRNSRSPIIPPINEEQKQL